MKRLNTAIAGVLGLFGTIAASATQAQQYYQPEPLNGFNVQTDGLLCSGKHRYSNALMTGYIKPFYDTDRKKWMLPGFVLMQNFIADGLVIGTLFVAPDNRINSDQPIRTTQGAVLDELPPEIAKVVTDKADRFRKLCWQMGSGLPGPRPGMRQAAPASRQP